MTDKRALQRPPLDALHPPADEAGRAEAFGQEARNCGAAFVRPLSSVFPPFG
jgi:hypothetical protein